MLMWEGAIVCSESWPEVPGLLHTGSEDGTGEMCTSDLSMGFIFLAFQGRYSS